MSEGSIARRKLLASAKEAHNAGHAGASKMPFADSVHAKDGSLDSSTSSSKELMDPRPIRRRCDGAPRVFSMKRKVCEFFCLVI